MAIFASTTLGSSDPSRAMSIKALEARAQALAAAQSKQEMPTSLPSPWQGASLVLNQAADAFATKRADQATAAGREDLAKTMSQIGPEGPTPEQQGRIAIRDPDMAKTYMAEVASRRAAAAEVAARKEAAAEAARVNEAAAVAQEGRIQARPSTDEVAQVERAAKRGELSPEDAAARKKKLLSGSPAEQKYETEMQEKSVAGQSLMSLLDEAQALTTHPKGIHAGPQAGGTQTIGENVPGFLQKAIPGVLPDPETTQNTQRFNQIMGEQALEQLTKMKGASSDRDVAINFKIVNDPNATLDNKKKALVALKNRIATLLQIHNDSIVAAGGKVPTLAKTESATAPAAAGGGGANAEAKAWLDANPNDPRAAAVRKKLEGG